MKETYVSWRSVFDNAWLVDTNDHSNTVSGCFWIVPGTFNMDDEWDGLLADIWQDVL